MKKIAESSTDLVNQRKLTGSTLDKVARPILFSVGVALLGFGTYQIHLGGTAQGVAMYGAAIFSWIFAFLSRFRRFKGFGIEGEMWEETQEKAAKLVEEIETRIDHIDEIVVSMAALAFTSLSASGRLRPVSRREVISLVDRLEADLRQAGFSTYKIKRAKDVYYRHIAFDLAHPIYARVKDEILSRLKDAHKRISDFPSPIDPKDLHYKSAVERQRQISKARAELRSIIENYQQYETILARLQTFIDVTPVLDKEVKARIRSELAEEFADLEHFLATHSFRRPDAYVQGDSE